MWHRIAIDETGLRRSFRGMLATQWRRRYLTIERARHADRRAERRRNPRHGALNEKKPCSHAPFRPAEYGSCCDRSAALASWQSRRTGRLLLVSLPLQKLALLVLPHLLSALLDHAAHADSPLASSLPAHGARLGLPRGSHRIRASSREAGLFLGSPSAAVKQPTRPLPSLWRRTPQAREKAPSILLRAFPRARFTG